MLRPISLWMMAMGLGLSACSASPGVPAPAPPGESREPVEPPAPDEQVAACAAQTSKLQAGLDKAHGNDTDAVMVVKDPSCGMRVLTSGPSKLDASHLHRIGSVTKTYVAAVILTLASEGALGLEDPVAKFVSGVTGGDEITVRQLLTHTSGLFNYTNDEQFLQVARKKTFTPRELVDLALANPPSFAPGEGWEYSNTNYILLGMIAEAAGKAKIGALVRARVFAKVGLAATFFDGEEPVGGELAIGRDGWGRDVTRFADPSWAWAAGAMVASPADTATWIEALGAGTFHDPATQAQMLVPTTTDDKNLGYGLGVMLFGRAITGGAGPGIGHGGDLPGYHTQAFYFPEKKTTLVAIVDSDAESPNDVSVAALEVLFR
ncbi:MAG: beta-lactamase family protein [Labilithrix sp.]|nr:beta-lactamase family protein [Labilithrix sp.]